MKQTEDTSMFLADFLCVWGPYRVHSATTPETAEARAGEKNLSRLLPKPCVCETSRSSPALNRRVYGPSRSTTDGRMSVPTEFA